MTCISLPKLAGSAISILLAVIFLGVGVDGELVVIGEMSCLQWTPKKQCTEFFFSEFELVKSMYIVFIYGAFGMVQKPAHRPEVCTMQYFFVPPLWSTSEIYAKVQLQITFGMHFCVDCNSGFAREQGSLGRHRRKLLDQILDGAYLPGDSTGLGLAGLPQTLDANGEAYFNISSQREDLSLRYYKAFPNTTTFVVGRTVFTGPELAYFSPNARKVSIFTRSHFLSSNVSHSRTERAAIVFYAACITGLCSKTLIAQVFLGPIPNQSNRWRRKSRVESFYGTILPFQNTPTKQLKNPQLPQR